MENSALFKVGYGLYILSAKNENRDNACMINTFMQISDNPLTGIISVNKENCTYDIIRETKKFNVSILSTDTPFELIKHFGFQSGKTCNKFDNFNNVKRSKNGLLYLSEYTNAFLSGEVIEMLDFNSHTVFKALITDAVNLSDAETLTYSYYQKNIKPKPDAPKTPGKGYRCSICNYVLDSDTLPDDFICPICKHGASDFVKL